MTLVPDTFAAVVVVVVVVVVAAAATENGDVPVPKSDDVVPLDEGLKEN